MKTVIRAVVAVGLGCGCVLLLVGAGGTAEAPSPVAPGIEAGFALWTKGGGVNSVLREWQRGGLLEGDNKVGVQANYFQGLNQVLGNYQSHELLQTKAIGRSSQVVYMAIRFERGAVYARFLLYRTSKDWVAQNMDFSTRPEALMPWLAFEGERNVD